MATIKWSEIGEAEPVVGVVNIYDKIEKDIDQKMQKAWRLIKKTRWQGHYNTRKRSRRF